MDRNVRRTPRPEWDLLLSAAQKNRPDLITEMVEIAGVNPSHSNSVGQSALHIACLWGNVASVEALVRLGANVNAQNDLSGATPLHMVIQSHKPKSFDDRLQVIKCLVGAGADINLPDQYGGLPIDAVKRSNTDYTETELQELELLLIDQSLNVVPPLIEYIFEKDSENVKTILEMDKTLSNLIFKGKTPLMHAMNQIDQLVRKTVSGEDVDCENFMQQIKKLEQIVETLLANGADPNFSPPPTKNAMDEDALVLPLHQGVQTLQLIYQKDPSHECAPVLENIACSQLYDKGGAEVTNETKQLLYQAARWNELALVKFLVTCLKIDPNTIGPQQMTPLHFAARSGRIEILRYLLNQPNINVDAKDTRGKTALDAARANDKTDVIQELEEFLSKRS